MPLTSGVDFAGFTILRMLGAGGMGEVYLAQHPRLPRREALKVLPAEMSANDEFRARFIREADLAAALFHPHIVGVHDRGEFEGQLWISMDYIDGTDAGRLIQDRYPTGLPRRFAVEVVGAVADALDYAHEHGLLHRDVKPANILLADPDSERRRILLADFGIARQLAEDHGLTRANVALGSVNYAAPEQLMGLTLDGRTDQYGLAATAYQLLCGVPLFDNPNAPMVINHHINTPPPKLAATRPELADLDPVLATGLAKEPRNRYPRCRDFAQALAAPVQRPSAPHRPPPVLTPPTTPPERPVRPPSIPPPPRVPPPPPMAPVWPNAPTSVPPRPTAMQPVPSLPPTPERPNRRAAVLSAIGVFVLIALAVLVVMAWPERSGSSGQAPQPTTTSDAAPATLTFESMRDFVIGYYAKLPADTGAAWNELSESYQTSGSGFDSYVSFWSSIRSVEVLSVSPRTDTSVTARLRYSQQSGATSTEDRWLSITLVDGRMLIADSGLN